MSKRIPIAAAKRIAKQYGYDQVAIYARKVGPDGGAHVATYGVNKAHCEVAGKLGQYILGLEEGKYKLRPTGK